MNCDQECVSCYKTCFSCDTKSPYTHMYCNKCGNKFQPVRPAPEQPVVTPKQPEATSKELVPVPVPKQPVPASKQPEATSKELVPAPKQPEATPIQQVPDTIIDIVKEILKKVEFLERQLTSKHQT